MSTLNYLSVVRKSPAIAMQVSGYEGHRPPPQWVLDRLADEQFSGGFDLSPTNRCPQCFTAKSANGSCFC